MSLTREEATRILSRKGGQLVHVPKDGKPKRVTSKTGFPPEADGGELAAFCDETGRLTRAGMRAVLASGGSVMHNGNMIETSADLPDEEELAGADAERVARLKAELERTIDDLQTRRARLDLVEVKEKPVKAEPVAPEPVEETHRHGRHRRSE